MSETANGRMNGTPVKVRPVRPSRKRVKTSAAAPVAAPAAPPDPTVTVESAHAPVSPADPAPQPPALPVEEIHTTAVEVVEVATRPNGPEINREAAAASAPAALAESAPPSAAPTAAPVASEPTPAAPIAVAVASEEPRPAAPEAVAPAQAAPQEPPPIIWYLELPQPDFPTAEAVPRLPSSVIYSPDVDRRPMKGLAFDLRAWGYGHLIVMRLADSRNVRLNDGRILECPAGQTIIVPIVTDLEALIPPMLEHPLVALEIQFAPIGIEIDAAGQVRVRFATLPPVVTEVPRNHPSLWVGEAA